jgi:type VI secretion system protein ImpK
VRQRLVDFLEAQAVAMTRRLAEHELRVYDEAQYVMTAMADEVLLHLDWGGRTAWAERPLEAHMFHSHDAGERFFRKLDDVLENRATASTGLLLVYLAALALGFQGKFAALGSKSGPEGYRQRLARHLARLDPALAASRQELCAEVHEHTLENASRTELASLRGGWLPLLVVVACLLVAAQILWAYRISNVAEALDRIEGAS